MQFMHGGSGCLVYGGHPFTSLLHSIHFRMFKRGESFAEYSSVASAFRGGAPRPDGNTPDFTGACL